MIYIHIPFCRSFCTYCDFYSEVAAKCRDKEDEQKRMFESFSQALGREISLRAGEMTDEYNTIYIGGGTPSVLPLDVYSDMVGRLADAGIRPPFKEFTFEVNPEDVVEKGEDYIRGLMALGVDRFSMGVQSFDDGILKWMNRRHDSAVARQAYGIMEKAGAGNISIDLIFGLPQLSDDLWRDTLMKALDISPTGKLPKHISAYQLSVEPGSALAAMVDKGQWSEADDELCARQYSILCQVLKEAGYNHYEISNFALPGYEARHNSAYWFHVPYVGLGPGAHSLLITQSPDGDSPQGHRRPIGLSVFCSKIPGPVAASDDALLITQSSGDNSPQGHGRPIGLSVFCSKIPGPVAASDDALLITRSPDGDSPQGKWVRRWNEPDLKRYIGNPEGCTDGEELTSEQIGMERIMLALRTSDGADEEFMVSYCGEENVNRLLSEGDLERTGGGRLRIPEERFFVSDRIISEII